MGKKKGLSKIVGGEGEKKWKGCFSFSFQKALSLEPFKGH
jgi:hypothetical protein